MSKTHNQILIQRVKTILCILEKITGRLSTDVNILDFGCHDGENVRILRSEGIKLHGFDNGVHLFRTVNTVGRNCSVSDCIWHLPGITACKCVLRAFTTYLGMKEYGKGGEKKSRPRCVEK